MQIDRNVLVCSALWSLAIFSQGTIAQDMKTGLSLKADSTLAFDDNIYRVPDELARSDTFLALSPEINVIGVTGKHRYQLTYLGDYAKFKEESGADYTDHDIRLRAEFNHSLRFGTQFSVGYKKEHEDPGSINLIQLDIQEYNKYDEGYVNIGMALGQESSIGRLSFNYRRTNKDFTNNNLDFLDFVGDQYIGRFTYRIAPKTKLYTELSFSDLDYEPNSTFELDNELKRYSAGISWDFTNKLSGDINIGYQERNYLQETIQDIDGLTYTGTISWSINTYTELEIDAIRETVDTTLNEAGGSFRTTFGLDLSHELTELMSIKLNAGYADDELVFTTNRNDKRYRYGIQFDYELLRTLTIFAKYSYEERDSSLLQANFKANIISLNLLYKLDK